MRLNLPVTDREHVVVPGVSIVSKTDLHGNITYANDLFVHISGYSREELMGQPHNLLRHPDMPTQAFAHMWSTLKKGNPWKGIVKNRTKDGGFYWVKAVVVPVRKHNTTIGYMSVREKASPEEIHTAQESYAAMNSSKAPIRENRLSRLLTIKSGFFMGTVFVIFLLVVGGLLGIGGLWLSNHSADTLKQAHIEPLGHLSTVQTQLHHVQQTVLRPETGALPTQAAALQAAFDALIQTQSVDEAPELFQAQARLQRQLLAFSASPEERVVLSASLDAVQAQIAALRETVLNGARTDHANMIQRNMRIWQISLIGLGAGILIVIAVGRFFLRDIVIPLKTAIHHFDRIAQGDLGADIDVYGKGETGQLSRASVVMQMHLKVITDEICLVAHGIRDHCAALNAALFEIADHSEIQHDRLSEARTVLFQSEDFLNELHTLVGTLKIGLPDSEGQASLATLEKIENALRLQTFAFEDFLNRIEAIAELVVNNREDTQSAYALSEQLQQAADELYGLVAYFSPIPSSATEVLPGKPLG